MSSKRTQRTARPAAPRTSIADQGNGWRIEFDRETRDYSAIIELDSRGYIGSRSTASAARTLISETMMAAAAH